MIFLAYLTSVFIFLLANIIVTAICLALYTGLVGLINKTSNAPYHATNQFLGTCFGTAVGALLAFFAFDWFDKSPNIYILLLIFLATWFLTNSVIKREFKPTAQRAGAITGMIIILLFKLLKDS